MDTEGKIAVLLATYNGALYLPELLASLLAQSCRDFVILAHDDGSSDETPALLRAFARDHPGLLRILPGAPTGSARDNFLFLLSRTEAPCYMFCDQDDIWLPDKVALTLAKMRESEQEGKPALVFTELSVADARGRVIREKMSEYQHLPLEAVSFRRLLIQNVVSGCTVMINRTLRDMALQDIPAEDVIMHDWYLALIAARFGTVAAVETPTILYRQHDSNSVGARDVRSLRYLLSRLRSGDVPASLAATRRQAALFARQFGEDSASLCARYAALGRKGKLRRLRFYAAEGVRKSGLLRNLGLVWFG